MEKVFEFGDHRCVKCGQENGPSYFFKDRKTMEYMPDTNLLDAICSRCGYVWKMRPKDHADEAEKVEEPKRKCVFIDSAGDKLYLRRGAGKLYIKLPASISFHATPDQWAEVKAVGDALLALDS